MSGSRQTVEPNDSQRAILDELKTPRRKHLTCSRRRVPRRSEHADGRTEAMRQRLDAMLQAVRHGLPAMEKFYQSLDDEQKARFNALAEDNPISTGPARFDASLQRGASASQACPWNGSNDVRPDEAQRSALKELQDARRGGQSVELGLPHLSGTHARRPSAGD